LTLFAADVYIPPPFAALAREARPLERGFHRVTQTSPAPGASDDERAAVCALAAVEGVGARSLELLVASFGSLASAVQAGPAALSAVEGLRPRTIEALRAAGDLAVAGRRLLERARGLGASVLQPADEGYPSRLRRAASPPPVLYVLGDLGDRPGVAVVGSRRSDDYGLRMAEKVADVACRAGLDVVSGGAEGVDHRSHQTALVRGGRTVAVVGTGLANPYPAAHRDLYERISLQGAVVSEFPPDAGGHRSHFPRRNRTMAGLCDAVVLVRGDAASGALTTCEAAAELQRPVYCVPGRVDEKLSEAPNGWLARRGGRALLTGEELLSSFGLTDKALGPVVERPATTKLEGAKARLHAALGPSPRHVDEVAAQAGLTASEALAGLLELELSGLCAARPGMYFARR
jgi:DNA processing protein